MASSLCRRIHRSILTQTLFTVINSSQPYTSDLFLHLPHTPAILVGKVGQNAIEKKLRSGRKVTMLSIGTGGMRNNRRPLQNEEPRDYASRSMVQWHRVSIYPERLGALVAKNAVPGSILYLEGNLETKIFNDPITGLTRRVREVAVRRDGRVVFLQTGSDGQEPQQAELKGVGYY
ncbi:single-stranded DNA-binding protein, mitochondrial [Tanacetum coccineum]